MEWWHGSISWFPNFNKPCYKKSIGYAYLRAICGWVAHLYGLWRRKALVGCFVDRHWSGRTLSLKIVSLQK